MPQQPLPENLATAYASYFPLLGALPAELATRFTVSGELAPDFLLLFERMRSYVFYSAWPHQKCYPSVKRFPQ